MCSERIAAYHTRDPSPSAAARIASIDCADVPVAVEHSVSVMVASHRQDNARGSARAPRILYLAKSTAHGAGTMRRSAEVPGRESEVPSMVGAFHFGRKPGNEARLPAHVSAVATRGRDQPAPAMREGHRKHALMQTRSRNR